MAFNLTRLLASSVNHFQTVSQRGIKRYARSALIQLKERQAKYYESLTTEEYNELHRRSNFIEWNYSSEIFAFGKRLHEEFPPELLLQAFTHRCSSLGISQDSIPENRRKYLVFKTEHRLEENIAVLEEFSNDCKNDLFIIKPCSDCSAYLFTQTSYIVREELKFQELGVEDAKLNLKDNENLSSEGEKIIHDFSGRYVSYFFPRFPKEGIESIANYLSSEEVLAHISKNLGTTFLILSADYPVETQTYSKTLKAIVGALKECQGLPRSHFFVRDIIVSQLAGKDVNDFLNISNPLETLSEILKNDGKDPPEPRIICQSGMNTILANYHVGIYSNKQLIGHSSGESIDIAVEMAAHDALKRLFHTTDSCTPISYDIEEIPQEIRNLRLNEWSSRAIEKQCLLPKFESVTTVVSTGNVSMLKELLKWFITED